MLRQVVSILLLSCSVAYATTRPFTPSPFGTELALTTTDYVQVNGEYRICKPRTGSEILVIQGMCLWESELPANALEHPDAVAGLVVEKADTLSVDEFLLQRMARQGLSVSAVREIDGELIIQYRPEQAIFLSSQ